MPYKDREKGKEHQRQYYAAHRDMYRRFRLAYHLSGKTRKYLDQRAFKKRMSGICTKCSNPLALNSTWYCEEHLVRHVRDKMNRYYMLKSRHRCAQCAGPLDADDTHVYCITCTMERELIKTGGIRGLKHGIDN